MGATDSDICQLHSVREVYEEHVQLSTRPEKHRASRESNLVSSWYVRTDFLCSTKQLKTSYALQSKERLFMKQLLSDSEGHDYAARSVDVIVDAIILG